MLEAHKQRTKKNKLDSDVPNVKAKSLTSCLQQIGGRPTAAKSALVRPPPKAPPLAAASSAAASSSYDEPKAKAHMLSEGKPPAKATPKRPLNATEHIDVRDRRLKHNRLQQKSHRGERKTEQGRIYRNK